MVYHEVYGLIEEITEKEGYGDKVDDEEIVAKWVQEAGANGISKNKVDLAIDVLSLMACYGQGVCCSKCCDTVVEFNETGRDPDYEEYGEDYAEEDYYEYDKEMTVLSRNCECPCDECIDEIATKWDRIQAFDDQIPDSLRSSFLEVVKSLPGGFWHPNSNSKVFDIVHPSLYCDVDDATTGIAAYRWIPADFRVSKDEGGKVTTDIRSYINGLPLYYKDAYDVIGKIFSRFVPMFEKTQKIDLTGDCQVLVKIGQVELKEDGDYPAGSWHLEGIPTEHIYATGIYYFDVDNISDSYLEFRHPLRDVPADSAYDYGQDDPNAWRDYRLGPGRELINSCGRVKAETGRCAVFPNVVQHRIREFHKVDESRDAKRGTLVFFLIDPQTRINSTADVIPKRPSLVDSLIETFWETSKTETKKAPRGVRQVIGEFLGIKSPEDALSDMKNLMETRMQDYNRDRAFANTCSNLCEH